VRIDITNLYSDEVGNAQLPKKFHAMKQHRARVRWASVVVGLLVVAAIVAGAFFVLRRGPTRPGASIVEKSIAVLPFENRSDEKQNAYFADGVQDEILTDLARVADLKVISRTSVMQYKTGVQRSLREIGQQLGVAHLLEGSVQRVGNKVRVNAQLIDARTDAHLWAQTYDRDLADIFAIQSEIAKTIADQLQAKLSPNEKKAIEQPPTSDVTAFELYSRAKTLMLTLNFSAVMLPRLREAVDLLDQATARDPSFFAAYCLLANANDSLYNFGDHTPARLGLAEAALQAVFRLRPDAGEAHYARAGHLTTTLDHDGALAELEIAHRLLPNDPRVFDGMAYIAARRGHFDEGIRYRERALELDPRNVKILQHLAYDYYGARRYAQEARILDRAIAVKPDDVTFPVRRALTELNWKANTHPLHDAINSIEASNPAALPEIADTWLVCALAERDAAAAERAVKALGDHTFGSNAVQFPASVGEGLIARMTNDQDKAAAAFAAARAKQEKIVQAQPDNGPALSVLGLIDAGLGRKEQALREGGHAIELLPPEKDSVNGGRIVVCYALTCTWVGEKGLACEQLEKAKQLFGGGLYTYGQLKLLPHWDSLRGDPRFEKIVQSLAPK
jgi:serine/threonine-protein kinase